MAVFNQDMVK